MAKRFEYLNEKPGLASLCLCSCSPPGHRGLSSSLPRTREAFGAILHELPHLTSQRKWISGSFTLVCKVSNRQAFVKCLLHSTGRALGQRGNLSHCLDLASKKRAQVLLLEHKSSNQTGGSGAQQVGPHCSTRRQKLADLAPVFGPAQNLAAKQCSLAGGRVQGRWAHLCGCAMAAMANSTAMANSNRQSESDDVDLQPLQPF